MIVIRRSLSRWPAAIPLAAVLLSSGAAATNQPAHEIDVVASKFAFEPSTIHVIPGEPVRLVVRSKDGTHGLSIPKLNIDVRVPKTGDPVTVEFTAPAAGLYEIACSEFCGSGHGQMKAGLVSAGPTQTSR